MLNSQEAKAEATERSLLHIIKPEIDFDPIADEHDEKVYKKAVENFKKWRDNKWLVQDGEEHYYIYAQTINGRTQYGLAMCCYYEDYWSGKIKKHELTRIEKDPGIAVRPAVYFGKCLFYVIIISRLPDILLGMRQCGKKILNSHYSVHSQPDTSCKEQQNRHLDINLNNGSYVLNTILK